MKSVFLLLLTNFAILFVLNIVLSLLGLNFGGLLELAFLLGMGGSLLSLFMSKWMAKNFMGAQVIEQPRNNQERWLLNTVQNHARAAGIGMPEVALYNSREPNAFATGSSRNNSLVAVSTGLLDRMNAEQASAVLAHEVGHVGNGDMVALTLIQGVLNTFVYLFSWVIGSIVDRALHGDDEGGGGHGIGSFIAMIASQIVLGFLASIIVLWFSRRREYRADAVGAQLAGTASMIGALQVLQRSLEPEHMPEQFAAFGISGVRKGGLQVLFSTHPPIEDRIAALREGRHLAGQGS